MKLELDPYQKVMVNHLIQHSPAYCTVGLGLGKTASTLCALNALFMSGEIRSALVVAPLRVARLTWPNEIEKWDDFHWMEIEHLKGNPKGWAQLYLINYERLTQLTTLDFADLIIFDEITRAKNHQSSRIQHFLKLVSTKHRRWGLTGTPRPNSLLELFGQLRTLDSGERLGRSFSGFRDRFFYPTDYMRYNWVPKPGAEDKVYEKISDITLTLRSEDYLDIPDMEVIDVPVKLEGEGLRVYEEMRKKYVTEVDECLVDAVNAAVAVNKLLQVCSGAIYNRLKRALPVHENKIVALKKLLKEINEPVIIACVYQHEIQRICDLIPGAVNATEVKGDLEKEWNSGKISKLVAHPASLGHGLNLQHGGRTIIWFTPTWSRELYDQFNARVARRGQDKPPRIYRLLTTKAIDEAVVETLRERGNEQAAMLQTLKNLKALHKVE